MNFKPSHIAAITLLLGVGVAFGNMYADRLATERAKALVDQKISQLPPNLSVSYTDIEAHFIQFGRESLVLKRVSVTDHMKKSTIKIDEVSINNMDTTRPESPYFMDVELNGVHAEIDPTFQAVWSRDLEYGDTPIVGDVDFSYLYNPESKDYGFKGEFELKKAGSILVELNVANMPPLEAIDNKNTQGILIKDLSFIYHDASFFNRAVNQMARKGGVEPSSVKGNMKTVIDKNLTDKAASVKEKIKNFIDKPSSLNIVLTPKKPSSIGEIMVAAMIQGKDLKVENIIDMKVVYY